MYNYRRKLILHLKLQASEESVPQSAERKATMLRMIAPKFA